MLFLLSMLSVTESIISSKEISLEPYEYSNFVWFGFQEGGQLEISVTLKNDYSREGANKIIKLYLCTPEEFKNLGELTDHCLMVNNIKSSSNVRVNYKKKISEYITYEIVIRNEYTEDVSMEIKYELTNPGGEQLSSGFLEMKYIMLVFSIAWGILLCIWILKWILVRHKKPTVIQIFLVLNCFIWCTFSLIFHYYLHDFSKTGKSNKDLFLTSRVAMFVSLSFLFSLLELISEGIGITLSTCNRKNKLKLGFKLILFTLWFLLSELHFGKYVYYLLSAILAVFLVTYLREICKTINDLEEKMNKMLDEGLEVIDTDIWHQIRMYRMHSISFIVFLVILGCVSALYDYYRYMPWIGMGTEIYVIFIWILLLSTYFRFREKNPYLKADSLSF